MRNGSWIDCWIFCLLDYVFVPRSGRGEQLLYPSCQTSHYAGYLRSAISLDEPRMTKGRSQFLPSTHCQYVTSVATNQISILCTSLAYVPMVPMGKETAGGKYFDASNWAAGHPIGVVPKSETFIDVDRLRFSVSSCYFWSWSTEEGAWTWRWPTSPQSPQSHVVYYCGHMQGINEEPLWKRHDSFDFVWFIGNNTVCTNILLSKPAHFDILWILRIRHWQLHTLSLVGGFSFSNVQYVACILPLKDIYNYCSSNTETERRQYTLYV